MIGSIGRRPRFQALANGKPILGAVSAEVSDNGYLQSNRFRLTIAIGPDKDMTPAWWSDNTDVMVEIKIGLLPDGAAEGTCTFTSLIIGAADLVEVDLIQGNIHVEGRDLAAQLIETKTQEAYANKTASQIATILANNHGLTPVVTATSAPVGQYYQLEHDKLQLGNFSRQTTEWDLLTTLAEYENFDVWVQGKELHFAPAPESQGTVFGITYQPGPPVVSNVMSLQMERHLILAKDIQVTVKTWNHKHKTAFTRVVKAYGATAPSKKAGTAAPQNYVFIKPNMTPDQALKFGQAKLADLTKHERILRVEMPGELVLTTRGMVSLTGTGTSWDQNYYVAELTREIGDHGFYQRLRLKNSSPRTQQTVL